MNKKKALISLICIFSLSVQATPADPFRVVYPAGMQVLSNSAGGPGPGAPTGPGPYFVANMSSLAQFRGWRVTVPAPLAAQLPTVCKFVPEGAPEALAYKGREIGPIGTEFHVMGNVPGFGTQNGRLEPGTGNVPPFQFSDWITDDPVKMQMFLTFGRNSLRQSIPFVFKETLENSPVVRTDRYFAGPVNGVWGEVFLTFYTNQDVVDLEGHFGWCDQSVPDWFTHFESIEFTMGEDVELYFAAPSGYQPIAGGWQLFSNAQIENGHFPHGMGPQFFGSIMAKSDIPATANPPDKAARLARLDAAREGPILMTGGAAAWEGNWFAFGEVPKIPLNVDGIAEANASAQRFRTLLNQIRSIWEIRPLANVYNTGGTGDQPPFGASKGTLACTVGDPRFLWELLFSATDSGLRVICFKEPNGDRVLAANHPHMSWYSGYHDWRVGNDLLGKFNTDWQPDNWNLGRHGYDDQHRGMNNLWAAAALTGSRIVQEVARDLLQCELSRINGNRHTTTDAPRACRIFQDFVKMYHILPNPQEHADLMQVMGWRLTAWETGWSGGSVSGPVKIMSWSPADRRVLEPPRPFFVPWNEAVGLLGMLEARALMRKIGRTDLQTRYENFIRPVITAHLKYSLVRNNQNRLLPINGVHWLTDGQAQPASYYNIYNATGTYRRGISTTNGEPQGTDLLLGDAGWFSWWSGLIAGAFLLFPSSSFEYQKAQEIKSTQVDPISSLNASEWYAVGQ